MQRSTASSRSGDRADESTTGRFHLVVPAPEPQRPAPATMGDPEGVHPRITLSDRNLSIDGQSWLPVMGEYHFSRDDARVWRTELWKMRANGITVLATYVIWLLHEPVRGEVDWSGNRDLRRFLKLADEAGLKVVLRIGPWAHGEARNGGFPDWVQALPVRHRTNDEAYLEIVRPWYAQIAEQVRDLVHSSEHPEGPIIGIQVDNELYDQPDHLGTLRSIAEEQGMHASIWVATGWGGAQLPGYRLMPVYAGYSDGFWEEWDIDWPEFGAMHFAFSSVRDDLSVGADLRSDTPTAQVKEDDAFPFATCELGAGMHVAYHRRPVVEPADVAALALSKLGSGSAWQGYYLYHGVTQQDSGGVSTQESHATNYPNDLSQRDYDFFAPIGAAGQLREHAHLLRRQHLFIESWGDRLAGLPATVADASDDARWAVRADERSGFLFVNNHQPRHALPVIKDAQFTVDLVDARCTLPSQPVQVASGVSFIWPLRQAIATVGLLSGTVELLTERETADGHLVVVSETEGVPVELLIENLEQPVEGATTSDVGNGVTILRPIAEPGPDCRIRIGRTVILVLDRASSTHLWKLEGQQGVRLLIWDGSAVDGDTLEIESGASASTVQSIQLDGTTTSTSVTAVDHPLQPVISRQSGRPIAPIPVRTGGPIGRASGPTGEDWAGSGLFNLAVPPCDLQDGDEVVLSIRWLGDAARLLDGETVVSDQFWSGREWEINITEQARHGASLAVEILPWTPGRPIYLDPSAASALQDRDLELSTAGLRIRRLRHL